MCNGEGTSGYACYRPLSLKQCANTSSYVLYFSRLKVLGQFRCPFLQVVKVTDFCRADKQCSEGFIFTGLSKPAEKKNNFSYF